MRSQDSIEVYGVVTDAHPGTVRIAAGQVELKGRSLYPVFLPSCLVIMAA
jgi:hypothetical protein